MYLPSPAIPNPTCIKPANKKIVSIAGKACSTLPLFAAIKLAITTILTAVIGAVGPEI